MTHFAALWLPVLLSAILVFVASSIIHMASPWHKSDYRKLTNEREIMDALRPVAPPPGDYMVPRPASMADMKSEEFKALHRRGPVVLMTVFPSGEMGMGPMLVQWLIYCVVTGLFAAFVACQTLAPGATYGSVFRVVGTVAFAGYALALWQLAIWYRRSLSITIKSTVDGLIYALLTAGVFGWLWPR